MINREDILHLALLARFDVSPEEAERYRADLAQILDYISELQKLDTSGVEPLHNVLGLTGALRGDEARILRDERLASKLLKMAPKVKDGFVAVPRVLYHDH